MTMHDEPNGSSKRWRNNSARASRGRVLSSAGAGIVLAIMLGWVAAAGYVATDEEDEEEPEPLPICIMPEEINLVCHAEVDVTMDGEHLIVLCVDRLGKSYHAILGSPT